MTTRRNVWIMLLALVWLGLPAAAHAQAISAGDKVEAYDTRDFTWHKATVVKVGTDDMQGRYLVHFDGTGSNWDQWLEAKRLRSAAGSGTAQTESATTAPATSNRSPASAASSTAPAESGAPRLGKYGIYSYGAPQNPRIYLGHVELLAGGKYRVARTSGADYYGSGDYSFDAASKGVQWTSGPFKENGWNGQFTIEREGKTHKIRLARTTIATNSVD